MGLILLILIILLTVGGYPAWGWHHYGYAPSGVGLILVIVLILLIVGGRL